MKIDKTPLAKIPQKNGHFSSIRLSVKCMTL